MRTALVTGAAGFLGSHLVRALAPRFDTVDTVDLRPLTEPCPGREITGDVRTVLPELGRYDAVFHLAASVGGRAAIEAGPLEVAGNLSVDLAFFDLLARTRPAHACYLSSSAVYPVDGGGRLAEDDVTPSARTFGRPDATYGWVKLTGEHLAQVVRERSGVPVVCYRPFTVYGPGQGPEYPVTGIASRALARRDPLTVWGSGRQLRDLVHVQDCVAVLAAGAERTDLPPALNVCSGVATDFATLALLAADLVGYTPTLHRDLAKPGGVASRVGSPSRLDGWALPRRDLREGLADLLDHLGRRTAGA